MKLWKTKIIIWTDYNPSGRVELDALAEQAMSGDAYCSEMESFLVRYPFDDPDWDDNEFFDLYEEEDSEEEDLEEEDADQDEC